MFAVSDARSPLKVSEKRKNAKEGNLMGRSDVPRLLYCTA